MTNQQLILTLHSVFNKYYDPNYWDMHIDYNENFTHVKFTACAPEYDLNIYRIITFKSDESLENIAKIVEKSVISWEETEGKLDRV